MKRLFYPLSTLAACLSCCLGTDIRANTTYQAESVSARSDQDMAREKLLLLLSGEWVSRGLYVATKLEIADHLKDGPKTAAELAVLTQSNPDALSRLLHMLAGFNVFEETAPGIFANSDASLLLAKSNPDTLHAISLLYGEGLHKSWDELLPSIQTGTPAFQLAFKQPVFAFFKDHPGGAALFQKAMQEKSMAVIKSSLAAYPFGQFDSVYDIGGGYGHFVQAIAALNPQVKGLVFDVEDVIAKISVVNPKLASDRVELCAGDFFVSVPAGGDAYLLKSVLHDWDDVKAEQILRNCHLAMGADSKLLIVETVLLPKDQSPYANCMDLLMLAVTGGKERSLAAFEQMLDNSGFALERVYTTSTEFSILEARKK